MEPKKRVKALGELSSVKVLPTNKITRYFLTGNTMYTYAKHCYKEMDYEKAYFFYLRYISLFLEEVQKHPEYKTVSQQEKQRVRNNVMEMLDEAETIKKKLLEQYDRDYRLELQRQENEKKKNENVEQQTTNATLDIRLPDIEFTPKSGSGLQTVQIPNSLISRFLDLARSNTKNNIETCALLAGTLHKNSLIITALIVPQQSGTSDDCTAENDLATFNAMESNDLLTFGWIHTHPSQEAFLSSVDLHSQYGYQSMLPEAIAIVCAPKHSNEVFRLTDMGLDIVGNCVQKGFHPHPGPPLFEKASHIIFGDIPCRVIDLRNSTW